MTASYNPTEAQRLIDWARIAGISGGNILALADAAEAAGREVERLTRDLAEVGSGRFDAEVLAESRRMEASSLRSERDSLRQQLEAAQMATRIAKLESAPWARDAAVAIQRTNDLAAAQRRIAELEAERDSLRAETAEQEASAKYETERLINVIDQHRRFAGDYLNANRVLVPVHEAAVALAAGMGRDGDPTGQLHHAIYDAVVTARAALTPEIRAALERL